jgi:L-lactate dehydrogenase (cytochrome)
LARRRIPRVVFDFVEGAAWDEVTARRNEQDFARFALLPRTLVDVSSPDASTAILGRRVSVPLLGAPTGQSGLVHRDGEIAIARALHRAGTITTLSTVASCSIEEVATASPGPTWFQLLVSRDRGLTLELLDRAHEAGHLALVLTVDVPRAGQRERDLRNGFSIPPRITLRSLADGIVRPRWSVAFVRNPRILMANFASASAGADALTLAEFVASQFDPTLNWRDLDWLRGHWRGPLVVKGILRPSDARRAVDLGAAGIIVSNHGGRQLDHALSAVRALPAVVDAVGGEAEVYLDGGVRRGTDVVKALALGARACMLGRPLIYGLGAGGEAGVTRALALLRTELQIAMALTGCVSLDSIDVSLVGPI